jgi:hypothetical protein
MHLAREVIGPQELVPHQGNDLDLIQFAVAPRLLS